MDEHGRLLGVLASGDGKLSEVIPAEHINAVMRQTDNKHQADFLEQAKLFASARTLFILRRKSPAIPRCLWSAK